MHSQRENNRGSCPAHHQLGDDAGAAVRRWLEEFIMKPHAELGRKGAICPFVEPALHQEAVVLVTCPIGPDLGALVDVVFAHARQFDAIRWPAADRRLQALALLFPALVGEEASLIDRVHALVKDEVVRRRLMVGQFHPACAEPAARNPGFFPMRSPVPMLVLRRLAFHDILFLHQKAEWFAAYAREFGAGYQRPNVIDAEYARLYREAVAAHGLAGAALVQE